MQEKRRIVSPLHAPARFKFLKAVVLLVILSFCINAYLSIKMIETGQNLVTSELAYLAYQLNFGAIVVIFLISLTFILHRGFGALSRIEGILDQIVQGNRSLRITLRKGDTLIPLVERVNKILDLLEKGSKN
ncbi:MAG: hypothetical protein PHV55_09700 [Candidatus Omnitrophica bacterium]|nr:hypothetical protein [Candidatus Omnitrophota bacterium]